MKIYSKELIFGFLVFIMFAALIIWAASTNPQNTTAIFIAVFIVVIAMAALFYQVAKKRSDIASGAPAEDEFTRRARVYAGSRAFTNSMYLWLIIFIFSSSFSKPQTMLGVGILGSALIYGLWLLYFRTTGEIYEE